jgi:hypothetical protein
MLLIWLLLAPVVFLIYAVGAGLVSTWLHHYLVSTSKSGEYSHDHRACVFASLIWPEVLLLMGLIYTGRFISFLYKYPSKIYSEVQARRKRMQTDKK